MYKKLITFFFTFLTFSLFSNEKLTIPFTAYPPYVVINSNKQMDGPWGKIFLEVFKKLGYDVEIKEVPWGNLLNMLKDGSGAVCTNMAMTDERKTFVEYPTQTIGELRFMTVVLKDSGIKDNTLTAIKKYKIGLREKFAYKGDFGTATDLIKDESPDDETTLMKLLNKRVDVAVIDEMAAYELIKKLKVNDKVVILANPIAINPQYSGFSKANSKKDLVKKYDEIIAQMKKDGSYNKIMEEYKNK